MSYAAPVRRLVPLCQVEGCAKPLHTPSARNYLVVRGGPLDRDGRQVVVCNDCRPKFKPECR